MGVHRNKSGMDPRSYLPLGNVNTQSATPIDDMFANVERNIKEGYTRLHELPEFQVIKGHDNPIIIVGGGPSLKKPENLAKLKELAKKWPVMCAGSPHDWLIQNGIHPTYTAVCDPDPITALYTKEKNLNPRARYLFASCCAPELMAAVPKDRIAMWHCHSQQLQDKINEAKLEKLYQAIGGGCTVGLRCLCIASMFGYTNLHIFGMDSFVNSREEHHVFEFQDEEKEFLGELYEIRLGNLNSGNGPTSRVYLCAGYQLAQASHFKDFMYAYYDVLTPTFYGDSMLGELHKLIAEERIGRAA